ncbi:hypothetical protein [Georgenia sp. SYP-B2076]|uniref:hypothetical protein n=1 Tax=Georgenia sp. SYP-B2076 TaxID=2495881 RepID=UPI000F8DDE4D|nr:hypothetical protein [Georgenia sp. SYP-B2076]
MPATVLLNRVPSEIEAEIVAHGAHTTSAWCDGVDLVVSTGRVPSLPAADVLQVGGDIDGTVAGGFFAREPVMAPQWRITLEAELLGVAEIATANLLLDPPRTGMRWIPGVGPSTSRHVTPLVTAPSGHHAAMVVNRPGRGHLWWVSEKTLDYLPWVEIAMSYRGRQLGFPESDVDFE